MTVDPDSVHRTAKALIDAGEVDSVEAAEAALAYYVLQIDVGAGISDNATRQALVVTAVNTAARCFLGGVRVRLGRDVTLTGGWDAGRSLSRAVRLYGGTIVDEIREDLPTLCVGDVGPLRGTPVLRATFDGWSAGVVTGEDAPLAERSWLVPAGVAAGGIAVAEAFQWRRGDLRAGRRRQGVSLWRPELDWLSADAVGPDDVDIAPSRAWVMGLGHLGQAYLWTLGLLPWANPSEVLLLLQDDDRITKATESTGLLVSPGAWIGRSKARALAEVLEARGFRTALSERRFQPGHGPTGGEPRLGLIGVDNPDARRSLSGAGFEVAIDAGLGGGPVHYLDLQTHTFPAGRRSDEIAAWREARPDSGEALMELPAYARMAEESGDRCGTVEVAGRAVAAAFVGATASALVVAEATRYLIAEHRYSVIDGSLRDLSGTTAVEALGPPPAGNPGFARVRSM